MHRSRRFTAHHIGFVSLDQILSATTNAFRKVKYRDALQILLQFSGHRQEGGSVHHSSTSIGASMQLPARSLSATHLFFSLTSSTSIHSGAPDSAFPFGSPTSLPALPPHKSLDTLLSSHPLYPSS